MPKTSTSTAIAPLDHRLAEKQHHLRHLEKVAARYGHLDRFDVDLELEDMRRDITVLKQTLQARKSNDHSTAYDNTPPVRAALIEQITEQIASLKQALRISTGELAYLPDEALHDSLQHFLQISAAKAQDCTERWGAIQASSETTVKQLRAFLRDVWNLHASLHLLELREIHRRRHNLMEQQQIAYHQSLNPTLRQILEADIRTAQSAISALKRKWRQTAHDHAMLAIHEQNVRWNQEMLGGERSYTPIGLLRQLQEEEQALQAIDAQLKMWDGGKHVH